MSYDDDETQAERMVQLRREEWEKRSHIVSAQLFEADKPTTNGRVYPREVLMKMAADLNDRIAKGDVVGGVLDPESDDHTRVQEASHKILGVRVKGNDLVADIEILDLPAGRVLQDLVEHGGLFFTPVSVGTLVGNEVQDDTRINTIHFSMGSNPNYEVDG